MKNMECLREDLMEEINDQELEGQVVGGIHQLDRMYTAGATC